MLRVLLRTRRCDLFTVCIFAALRALGLAANNLVFPAVTRCALYEWPERVLTMTIGGSLKTRSKVCSTVLRIREEAWKQCWVANSWGAAAVVYS